MITGNISHTTYILKNFSTSKNKNINDILNNVLMSLTKRSVTHLKKIR